MKEKIMLLLSIFLMLNTLNAQNKKKDFLYMSAEFDLGNMTGSNLSLNYIHKEKISFQIGYSSRFRNSISTPDDYSSGLIGLAAFGLLEPIDYNKSINFTLGRVVALTESGSIRLNLMGGFGATSYIYATNWEKRFTLFGENYSFDYKTKELMSIILNPKIEIAVSQIVGFLVSPLLEINEETTYLGIGFGVILGYVKAKDPKITAIYK